MKWIPVLHISSSLLKKTESWNSSSRTTKKENKKSHQFKYWNRFIKQMEIWRTLRRTTMWRSISKLVPKKIDWSLASATTIWLLLLWLSLYSESDAKVMLSLEFKNGQVFSWNHYVNHIHYVPFKRCVLFNVKWFIFYLFIHLYAC